MTKEVNFVTDFGAVGDGITSEAAAVAGFKDYAQIQTEPIELTIPGGRYNLTASSASTRLTEGIFQPVTILGYGATLIGVQFGGQGTINYPATTARFQTASFGSNTVTLTTLADVSKFAVGTWVYIGAIDLQGFGQPPNHQLFEFNQITAINTSTGEITFAEALTNTYKSTYPVFNAGNNFNPDEGGPATLYNLFPSWPCRNYVYGITVEGSDFCYFKGIECLFEDCTFNNHGIAPTQTRIHTIRNCSVAQVSEIDKSVEQLYIYNSTFPGDFKTQSSSVKYMLVDGCTFGQHLNGTPLVLVVRNCTMPQLTIGLAYGTYESITLENCTIGEIRTASAQSVYSQFTVSNGTMSRVKTGTGGGVTQWGQPGSLMIHGNERCGEIFRVIDVREDGTNCLIDTTMPDPVIRPPSQYGVGGAGNPPLTVNQYYGAHITATNCIGSADAISLTNKGTRPFQAYYERTFTGDFSTDAHPGPGMPVYGRLQRIIVNVSQAYTGIQPTLTLKAKQGNNIWVVFADNTWANNWGYNINLKIAGTRVITPSGNSGLQSGDSVSTIPASSFWVPLGNFQPHLTKSIGAEAEPTWPIISITWEMSHDVPATAIAEVGAYSLAGTDVVLTQSQTSKVVVGPPGAYQLVGQDVAAASSVGPKLIAASAGAYALVGTESETLKRTRIRDMKISELGPAVALDGSELLPVVQNGVTVQAPISAIRDLPSYSVAEVPSAEDAGQGAMIYVTNGNVGAECMAVSDGLFWKVIALGATITP